MALPGNALSDFIGEGRDAMDVLQRLESHSLLAHGVNKDDVLAVIITEFNKETRSRIDLAKMRQDARDRERDLRAWIEKNGLSKLFKLWDIDPDLDDFFIGENRAHCLLPFNLAPFLSFKGKALAKKRPRSMRESSAKRRYRRLLARRGLVPENDLAHLIGKDRDIDALLLKLESNNLLRADANRGMVHRRVAEAFREEDVESMVSGSEADNTSYWDKPDRKWQAHERLSADLTPFLNDKGKALAQRYSARVSRAATLNPDALERVTDEYVRMSLELQQAFGLRREEAIEFRPESADRGDRIELRACLNEGRQSREIPIRDASQRSLLDRAKALANRDSLIPADRNYKQQLMIYEQQTTNAGLTKLHGLRHAYARRRYREITGRPPGAGGPVTLTSQERALDRQARLAISKELGFQGEQITSVFLGV